MMRLAAFGDEIGPDIGLQIEHLLAAGVRGLELRAAQGQGVLDLDGGARREVKQRCDDAGIVIFSIGSPIGKVPIDSPFTDELARLRRAFEQAHYFGAPRVRVFSFFVPAERRAECRAEVLERFRAMVSEAEAAGLTLCHENESRIYGETIAGCVDLLSSVDSPALRAVHDTANFVTHDEEPYPAAYQAVRPWLEYVHIKDKRAGGEVQPAGQGDGRMPELLAALHADGYQGYLSLEPHLGGGPDHFHRAATALRQVLDQAGIPYC